MVRHSQQGIGFGIGWPKGSSVKTNRHFARLANLGRQVVRDQDLVERNRIATAQSVLAGQRRSTPCAGLPLSWSACTAPAWPRPPDRSTPAKLPCWNVGTPSLISFNRFCVRTSGAAGFGQIGTSIRSHSLGACYFVRLVPQVAVDVADQDEGGVAGSELLERIFERLDLLLQHGAGIVFAAVAIQASTIQGRHTSGLQSARS
jgi:hypothetical protein